MSSVHTKEYGFKHTEYTGLHNIYWFLVPDLVIEGSPDIHAQSGSSVTLRCLVKYAIQEPHSISW